MIVVVVWRIDVVAHEMLDGGVVLNIIVVVVEEIEVVAHEMLVVLYIVVVAVCGIEVVAHETFVVLYIVVVAVCGMDVVASDTFVALVAWNIAGASVRRADITGSPSSASIAFGETACSLSRMGLPTKASAMNNSGNTAAKCLTPIFTTVLLCVNNYLIPKSRFRNPIIPPPPRGAVVNRDSSPDVYFLATLLMLVENLEFGLTR